MFGIGYQEMFVILVVALVVFGPARLPELAGQVGRWVRDFRRMSSDLTGEFEKTFAEVEEVKKSFQREIQSIQDEVEGVGKSTRGDLKKLSGKTPAAAKKSTASAAKATSSTATSATSSRAEKRAARANAKAAVANGNGAATELVMPLATKEDPLSDVSFFDVDAVLLVPANGHEASANGAASEASEALSRVRRRRASAAYAQESPARLH
jgi:sec-independent protein translocase protein TatB